MLDLEFQVKDLSQLDNVASEIASHVSFPACVYLNGEMGVGKTTLCKSIIKAFGYLGEVTSPTYNLIQEYPVCEGTIYHMDLYRLTDPGELEYLALEDLWSDSSIFLIEWAERGQGCLQHADFEISLRKLFLEKQVIRHIVLKK